MNHPSPSSQKIHPARRLVGTVILPSDKSIAQRTALLSALGDGVSRIQHYPASADPQSMLSCLRQLGIVMWEEDDFLYVHGRGLNGLEAPSAPLDCGNSGTAMRLLAGVLAGQPFDSVLVGDASLSRRPMHRVADPLREMGAEVTLEEGHAPLRITGGRSLKGITYRLPVPSAQIKSCVLLAGIFAEGETSVVETIPSRDHTERMLQLPILDLGTERIITITQGHFIPAQKWTVPRDFSAAAFFLVAGSIVREGEVLLPAVGMNPSRSGLLDVLRTMGADITVKREWEEGGEALADLIVRPARLHGVTVGGSLIPNLIDEIPILAVAATCAEGRTEIRDAAELRVKETDRIEAMAKNLRILGAQVETFPDGLAIEGGKPLQGGTVEAYDDHRIAMAMGVAGLVASGTTTIVGAEAASVSFPTFWEILQTLPS